MGDSAANRKSALEHGGTIIAIVSVLLVIGEVVGVGPGDHVKIATFLAIAILALLAPKIASFSVGKDGITANLEKKIDETSEKIDKTKGATIELDKQLDQKLLQILDEIKELRETLQQLKPATTVSKVAADAFKLNAVTVENDPQKNRFGGLEHNAGLVITADVAPSDIGDDWQKVTIFVRSTDASKQLTGDVEFFLHDTFRPDHYKIPAIQGEAKLVLKAWGAFTVGALAGPQKTALELDLATSKNVKAPKAWRER